MEKKEKFVRSLFNAIAPRYDFLNTLLSFGLHFLWKKKVVRILELREGDKIIDVCGGTADLAILAAEEGSKKGKVFLYDFSRPMMLQGREKVKRKWKGGQIYFIQGNAEQISTAQEIFDAAMISFGLRNLADMQRGVKEIFRVLKPGGKFVALEFSRPSNKWFKVIYDFYSFYIIPWAGRMISGSREAYVYLPASIRAFPEPEGIKTLLEEIGFQEVVYYYLTKGVAVIYRARKPLLSF